MGGFAIWCGRLVGMRFGISVRSVDEIDTAVRAEALGYDFCWVTDSQLLTANPWVVLALVAQRTTRLRIGPGLAIAGLRLAPVTANSIATINRLAPGRTFLGVGTGNTAMRMMGQRPMPVGRFGAYLRVVRALLNGEEVDYTYEGATHPIRFQNEKLGQNDGFIPMHIGGLGPRAQTLAGELGEGLVTSLPRGGTPAQIRANVATGAAIADRSLVGFETTALCNLMLLHPGEALTSERVLRQCGPAIMANVHYLVDLHKETGAGPPPYLESIWEEYLAFHQTRDEARRHQQLHQSHYAFLEPDEARFITPEMIRDFCICGQPEEIVAQIRALEAGGIDAINFIYPTDTPQGIDDFANQVISLL